MMSIKGPENQIPLPTEGEGNLREDKERQLEALERRAHESQAAYLARASEILTEAIAKERGEGILFDPARLGEEDLSLASRELVVKTVEEARRKSKPVSFVDNATTLEALEKSVGTHRPAAVTDPKDEAGFEKTQRERKLFEVQSGKGAAKRETYWNTLFFPYNTEATRALAKEILQDKIILLFGGGRARLKEEMELNGIVPKEVLNVDPFVSEVEPGADPVVAVSATDQRLPELLRERGIETVDEIWAEYSVPAYLAEPGEIKKLFQNVDILLAENGSLRIWPIEVKYGGETEVASRKAALMEALDTLAARGTYEIVKFEAAGRPGFTLQKVSPEKGS